MIYIDYGDLTNKIRAFTNLQTKLWDSTGKHRDLAKMSLWYGM